MDKDTIQILVGGIVLIVLILLIVVMGNTDIKPEFDRTGNPMTITVYQYNNKNDLNNSHPEGYLPREGWSKWYENDASECEIHVLKPKEIDDNVTLTWGHELVHCMYGRYHE